MDCGVGTRDSCVAVVIHSIRPPGYEKWLELNQNNHEPRHENAKFK